MCAHINVDDTFFFKKTHRKSIWHLLIAVGIKINEKKIIKRGAQANKNKLKIEKEIATEMIEKIRY